MTVRHSECYLGLRSNGNCARSCLAEEGGKEGGTDEGGAAI